MSSQKKTGLPQNDLLKVNSKNRGIRTLSFQLGSYAFSDLKKGNVLKCELKLNYSRFVTARPAFSLDVYAPEIISQTDTGGIRSPRPPFFHRGRNAELRC